MRKRIIILALSLLTGFGGAAMPPATSLGVQQAVAQDYLGLGGGRGRPGGKFFRGGERNQRYQREDGRQGEWRSERREREPRFERRDRGPRFERRGKGGKGGKGGGKRR
ncbi:MAG: hypothetical protein K5872_23005 [Rhizobiaceae bacterium]|nr:hypothetical protein [Rhizobiaceae bacterium]MCV0409089.1 hypothetical protein [Rhizobiaceae bacterium]